MSQLIFNALPQSMRHSSSKQKGAVLATSLIFLVILTVLAISGTKTSLLEEKMSANIKDKNLAFQAAETALRSGENWMNSESFVPIQDDLRVYALNANNVSNKNWWWPNNNDTDEENNGIASNMPLVSKNPRYIIEEHNFIRDSLTLGHSVPSGQYVHRVTAYAVGGTDNTSSVLQSSFLKRYDE